MPLLSPFDFQHHQQQQVGFVARDLISPEQVQWSGAKTAVGGFEPTSVLDPRGSPSPPNSCSTLSSSFSSSASCGGAHGVGGGAFCNTQPPCGGGVRVNGLQFDQSMFGYSINDNNDPSGLNNMISLPSDLDSQHRSGGEFGSFIGYGPGQCTGFGSFGNIESLSESFINHHQQLPSGFSDQPIFHLPDPKRVDTGSYHNSDYRQQTLMEKNPFFDHHWVQRQVLTVSGKIGMQGSGRLEEMGMNQLEIFEQIFKSAELVSMGNLVLTQRILARLNHQLSLIGKPLQRVAYYVKESLQLLLLNLSSNDMDFDGSGFVVTSSALSSFSPPLSPILKLGAFKSFCEVSPFVQFGNFTSNQAILEAVEMHERIHVIDFDIGYGGQWASFMQELAMRNCSGGMVSLKITAFVSTFDDLELQLTRDSLSLFAEELNTDLDFNVFGMDMLNFLPQYVGHDEAIAVNLPVGIFANCALSLPFVLRIIKQLSPKIVVSLERGCDRFDLPFSHNVIQAVQSYSGLLESLEAVKGNSDALQKIERFMIHPMIEKLVLQRFRVQDKSTPSRNIFISSGYTPLQFSNFNESQVECLVQRTPVQGFHIEKKQSSLILCWQQKELIAVTAWGS